MNNTNLSVNIEREINGNAKKLYSEIENFLDVAYPSYSIDPSYNILDNIEQDSSKLLDYMTFYKLVNCTIDSEENIYEYLNGKINKFFAAINSLSVTVAYGLVSYEGTTNLVLGINNRKNAQVSRSVIEGLLSGIELKDFEPEFSQRDNINKSYGMITGIPTPILNEETQIFDISPIMKSLNGENYTLLFIAKPIPLTEIRNDINSLMNIKDRCFTLSKRNISIQRNSTDTKTDTVSEGKNVSESKTKGVSVGRGTSVFNKIGIAHSSFVSFNNSYTNAHGSSKGWSQSNSKADTKGKTVSVDVENSYAIELMNHCDEMIKRLKEGQNTGTWQTAITYSADSEISRNIIGACLSSEISKPNSNLLPIRSFVASMPELNGQEILLPKALLNENINSSVNALCSTLNSTELGMLCTFPTESVPDFEIKEGKYYPLVSKSSDSKDNIIIGKVSDGFRTIDNMDFGLTEDDLNKHTFVCGITGSGKTTTVKGILKECKKPFMVIESSKKEYRHIRLDNGRKPLVYTLGKPEINCLNMNPFYIMPGIGLQTHIDFLKDLFNASFSFYGPMPYILERCLHNIYSKKGWNLELGFHPYLVNSESDIDFFDLEYMNLKKVLKASKFIYPTMQDLRDEVEHYIKTELQYDGEVAGNIKTAITTRLDSLCGGAKGFMFNTNQCIDMGELLNRDVIFELEGLADDSDKAFCVGLLIIFINEYRQVFKEIQGNKNLGLQHLLVIEEAHRLLKNINTERTSEDVGNPKGKAVEHFTNMLAEMRSYGQGVIIAEQIPSKLAPDVIKNSSNKIVQRIVSLDDQLLVGNTIGIQNKDAIYIGNLRTGYALCHKEGMNMPIQVKINNIQDNYVSDELIYSKDLQYKMQIVNLNHIRNTIQNTLDESGIKLLNTLFVEEVSTVIKSIEQCKEDIKTELDIRNIKIILNNNVNEIISLLIAEVITKYMMNGVYDIGDIIPDDVYKSVEYSIKLPTVENIEELKEKLERLYKEDLREVGLYRVSHLIKYKWIDDIDIKASICSHFFYCSETTITDIEKVIWTLG